MFNELKKLIGANNCASWMFMGCVGKSGKHDIKAYKHSGSREYVNLSADGKAWCFDGRDSYLEIDLDTAKNTAMGKG
ncbi:MAG: hypothetical protein BWK73_10440 [Thiothrix lacustris]|uniref:Uncharacterized protein n=1 Tax=Thiothrix lacustris TaxID=525917 RepID=A0A1Y1QUC2_9GAMM|nr:MAG: hypothetical protein BWK73_10440 [Thiothrix lacustris]